jgi:hypothetical protein
MTTAASNAALAAPQQVVERFSQYSLLGHARVWISGVLGGYLDWPTGILALTALCLRALTIAGLIRLEIPGRLIAALTLLYIGFFPIDYFIYRRISFPRRST